MIRLSASARRGLTTVCLAAAAATAAGCGSGGSSSQQAAASAGVPASASTSPGTVSPPASPSGPAATAGLAACDTSALSVTLAGDAEGGAAGSTYVPIDFTNTSGSACTLYGYPGVSFVTGPAGTQIGAAATRASNISSVSVLVAAHATAHAWLQVAGAGNYPAATCQPVTAHWLRVYPPGNTAASYVGQSFPACADGKVAILTVMPVRASAGTRGQIP